MRLSKLAKARRFGLVLLAISMWTLAAVNCSWAYEVSDTLEIIGLYKGENYFRLTDTSRQLFDPATGTFHSEHNDNLMSQRNELRLDAEWTPKMDRFGENIPPVRFFLQLRPWYDSDWQLSSEGQGRYAHELTPFWSNNLQGIRDDNDPLFREAYVDITPPHFFFRLGRQIIAWGKSDGVYMLDILNAFNLRNPTIFEEENIKIPIWAANLNWQPTQESNLQLLFIPQYFNMYWPGLRLAGGLPNEGAYHDWTSGITAFFNDFYNGQFGFKVPVNLQAPIPSRVNSAITGARWSDHRFGINYTLNYLYTYTPGLIDFPNTGNFLTATSVLRRPHHMQVVGGSADYDVEIGNDWVDGTVVRAETSETIGDEYYQGIVGNPRYISHWGVLMGVDKTVLGDQLQRPVFASFQYWSDLVTNNDNCAESNCGPKNNDYQDLGFTGSKAGMRGKYKSLVTMFLEKNWMEGDVLVTDFFTLYELQFHDWWIRPKITYKWTNATTVALGLNIFAGSKQTPYGQWVNNDNAFIEIRHTLF